MQNTDFAYSALPLFYSLFRFKSHHCIEFYIRNMLTVFEDDKFGAQRPVHSGFNVDIWTQYLEHYDDRIVVDFLHFGRLINFCSDVLPLSTFHNHPSAISKSDCLSSYITKELTHQSVFGPFHCNPFNINCVVLLLMCCWSRWVVEFLGLWVSGPK